MDSSNLQVTDDILYKHQECLYYNRSKDHNKWIRLLKISISNNSDIMDYIEPFRFKILGNREIYLQTADNLVNLVVTKQIKSIIFELMRNSDSLERYRCHIYVDKKQCRLFLRIYISPKYIHDICLNYQVAPRMIETIIDSSNMQGSNIRYTIDDIKTYDNIVIDDIKLPRLENLKLSLYTHQKNNLLWMNSVEKNVDLASSKFEYILVDDLQKFHTQKLNLFMDPISKIIYNEDSLWKYRDRCRVEYIRGGVLCDQVGLGKTLSMVCLILSNPHRKLKEAKKRTSIKISKSTPKKISIKLKNKSCISDNKSAMSTESDTSSTSTSTSTTITKASQNTEKQIFNRDLANKINAIPSDTIMSSYATAIYCPRRLVGQWASEIKKYVGDTLRVIELTTMTNINKHALIDLKDVDIVLVSINLLDNKKYREQEKIKLDKIYWHRLIIDEGHEVLLHNVRRASNQRINTEILNTRSCYKWVCTGTPLPETKSSMDGIISFLTNRKYNDKISSLTENISQLEYQNFIKQVFHRNTEKSSKGEISIPPIRESTDVLEFTKTERAIYDDLVKKDDRLQMMQVCTNIMISDSAVSVFGNKKLSLKQANSAMSIHFKDKVEYHKKTLESTQKELHRYKTNSRKHLKDLEEDLATLNKNLDIARKANNQVNIEFIQEEIIAKKRDILNCKSRTRNHINTVNMAILNHKSEIKYNRKQTILFTSLNSSQFKDYICPITGTKPSKIVITPTGQLYSLEGISMLFGEKKTIKDPLTRETIQKPDLMTVDLSDKTTTDNDTDSERNTWGTKMAHLIKTLNNVFIENAEHRIIIFSQWKVMLNLIAEVLDNNRIPHVFCRGNVHMMTKSINQFKQDSKIKVILLSSEDCSSGSNLTEATHVFLMDCVNAKSENAKAIEEQAIARAVRLGQKNNVVVKRFIIKDTIEEKLYRDNYGSNKITEKLFT